MTRLPPGSFLHNNRYRIDGFLGQGGFGITYRAHDTVLGYTREIGNALTIIHNTGIIHRDISPDNILITPHNKIVLIDFGSAHTHTEHTTKLTSVLNPSYTPPKQISPDPSQHGPPTDIYALAATLYTMLTGTPPTPSTERTTATSIEEPDPLIPPTQLKPDIPPQTENAILTALQHNRGVASAAFSPDGTHAITTSLEITTSEDDTPSTDGTAKIWKIN